MRILLIHPEDDPLECAGATAQSWDRIFDLGIAGPTTYERWTKAFGCSVEPYPSLEGEDFARLRTLFDFGRSRIVDKVGLDWWDLISIRWLDDFVQISLIRKVLARLGDGDQVYLTSKRHARLLDLLMHGRVQVLEQHRRGDIASRLVSLGRLSPREIKQILADKYDGDYRIRRLFASGKANCRGRVVLIPSGYGNASRAAVAYAAGLQDSKFLLVATRQSAWVEVADNVHRARLSSYAVAGSNELELQELCRAWEHLRTDFDRQPELRALGGLNCFDDIPMRLREGLAVRDSWMNVFENEPIASVLCPDEKNPYTRIPVLLARQRGIPTTSCHHGALDGRYLFTDVCADRFLAKSQMEWDYMTGRCVGAEEKIRVAGNPCSRSSHNFSAQYKKRIIFFSEPYEASNCRAREVYAEILPSLAHLASENGCELVIKLHPFESVRGRKRLVTAVVSQAGLCVTRVRSGSLDKELVQNVWFTATVSSTAALDCARDGIPSFLCTWFDRYGFGYSAQFVKFGAALSLTGPDQINAIPSLISNGHVVEVDAFSGAFEPEVLRDALSPELQRVEGSLGQLAQERLWA